MAKLKDTEINWNLAVNRDVQTSEKTYDKWGSWRVLI